MLVRLFAALQSALRQAKNRTSITHVRLQSCCSRATQKPKTTQQLSNSNIWLCLLRVEVKKAETTNQPSSIVLSFLFFGGSGSAGGGG